MKYNEMTFGRMEAVINKLGGEEGVQRFLSGQSEVAMKIHVVDCDADPYVRYGWSVEEHQRGGQLVEWDPKRIQLYLSPSQQNGNVVSGEELRKELKGKAVLNANVLDYLLGHLFLIPEEWKNRVVFFWGTIYRDPDGRLYVRYLDRDDRDGGSWHGHYGWLGHDWYFVTPAAVLASE